MTEDEEFLMLGPDSPNREDNSGCSVLFLIAVIIYFWKSC